MAISQGIGAMAARRQLALIMGSSEILCSSSSSSATHIHVGGAGRTQQELYYEDYHNQYIVRLRYIHLIEYVFVILGVVWSIEVLIMNTGTYSDSDPATKWYASDMNSLQSTIFMTYFFVMLAIWMQFGFQCWNKSAKARSTNLSNQDQYIQFMPKNAAADEDRCSEIEHISY